MLLAWGQRILSFREGLAFMWKGIASMLPAVAILLCAIAIRGVADDLQAGRFLASLLVDVSAWMLPVLTFLLAGFVAFSTGTSWGTMGILMPIAIPLAAQVGAGHPDQALFMLLVAGSVLDGAIFGDHCSLISDTTVMSSMASSCDHLDHVKTQIPYALLAMLAAGAGGYLFCAATGTTSPWMAYGIGTAAMLMWLYVFGRRAEA